MCVYLRLVRGHRCGWWRRRLCGTSCAQLAVLTYGSRPRCRRPYPIHLAQSKETNVFFQELGVLNFVLDRRCDRCGVTSGATDTRLCTRGDRHTDCPQTEFQTDPMVTFRIYMLLLYCILGYVLVRCMLRSSQRAGGTPSQSSRSPRTGSDARPHVRTSRRHRGLQCGFGP